jgi:hypothetical protein
VPGRDFPKLVVVVERDYPNVAAKMAALGPLTERLGLTTKGVTSEPEGAVEYLKGKNGTVRGGVADGRPRLDLDVHACEAILPCPGRRTASWPWRVSARWNGGPGGTPSPAGSISSSITTGWPNWASSCRSSGRRWTCGAGGRPRDPGRPGAGT